MKRHTKNNPKKSEARLPKYADVDNIDYRVGVHREIVKRKFRINGEPVIKSDPILVYVRIYSGAGNKVNVLSTRQIPSGENSTDYYDNLREIYMTSIYNRGFLDFMTRTKFEETQEHNYTATMNFENYKILSDSVLNGLYVNNKDFFDMGFLDIDIYVHHASLTSLFDNIYNGEEFYRNPENKREFINYTQPEIEEILKNYKLYEYVPLELPYVHFDNNIPKYGTTCITNMLIENYCTGNGKGIAKSSIEKHFNRSTMEELLSFVRKYNIYTTVVDVFGNVLIRTELPQTKSRKKDLICMTFNNHVYVYTKRCIAGTNPSMEVKKYNDNLYVTNEVLNRFQDEDDEMTKAKVEFIRPFTSNMSYKSEARVCTKSLKYLSEKIKGKKISCVNPRDLNKEIITVKYDKEYNLYKYKVKEEITYTNIFYMIEIDMKKAFHNTMINLMDSRIQIPVFAVDSIIKEYNNEDIHDSNIYYLKEEALHNDELIKRGVYSNYHHGFIINYLLKKKLIKKEDITHYKPFNKLYHINVYRERIEEIIRKYNLCHNDEESKEKIDTAKEIFEALNELYEDIPEDEKLEYIKLRNKKLFKLRKKFNSIQSFKDNYMLYNGLSGMQYTKPKCISVRVHKDNADEEIKNLQIKNKDLVINEIFDEEEYIEVSKKHKSSYKYVNNRNIYDYCISATNLQLLKSYDRFIKRNKKLYVCRINTDCITFLFRKEDYIVLDQFLEDNFKFKEVYYDTVMKTTNNINFTDPEEVLNNMYNELLIMNKNTTTYIGGPGTGKTHSVKNNHKYDFAMTISNVCCRNMDTEDVKADTIFSYFQENDKDLHVSKRLRKFYNKTIWFDEFSMLDIEYFNYIFLLTNTKNAKIIISGDPNQIRPFHSKQIDVNHVFFQFLFFNGETLEKNYRVIKHCDGEEIIDSDGKNLLDLSELVLNNLEDKDNCVEQIQQYYKIDEINKVNIHLTFNRDTRNMINNYIYKENNHKIVFNKDKLELTKGLRLIVDDACKKNEIYKSMIYEVKEDINKIRSKDKLVLRNVSLNKDEEIDEEMIQNMCLGFAITTHSSQGLTIREKCCIHQAEKMIHVDPKILYTAITRLTKLSDLVLIKDKFTYENDKLMEIKKIN